MKYVLNFSLIMIAVLFSGCFEILEEIKLNDDGSGQITMTVNISQSKTKLKSIMLMDSINNYQVPSRSDISENMEKMKAEIESVPGVSNVKNRMDFEEFIFSVTCDFENVEALNAVIMHFAEQGGSRQVSKQKQFSYDAGKKVFRRTYDFDLSQEMDKVRDQDREILDGATITTIYRFESPVLSADNPDSRIAGNKGAVMLKVGASDMLSNKKNIKNTITLK